MECLRLQEWYSHPSAIYINLLSVLPFFPVISILDESLKALPNGGKKIYTLGTWN